jgi:hypothetical protein
MRIHGFLAILFGVWVAVCGASDSVLQGSSPSASPFSADWFNPSAARHDLMDLPTTGRQYRGFDFARDEGMFCLKMRVFEMKRESRYSDVVEPDGQSTCQRASKYSVKKAEEFGAPPSR